MTRTAETETALAGANKIAPDTALRLASWVWLGMVIGVSMIATPAKFNAESLELAVALDVGRTTFKTFNWIQWATLLAVAAVAWRAHRAGGVDRRHLLTIGGIFVIMTAQSFWILPELYDRVAIVVAGDELPDSPIHFIFGAFEGAKLLLLGLLGFIAPRARR